MKTITHKINLPSYVIIILLFVHGFAMGQTPTKSTTLSVDMGVTNTDYQSTTSALNSDSCSANDFTLGNFYLADINGNPLDNNCTPGTPQTAYIFAFFNANTAAGRYSLYIDYDVFINGSFSYHVNDCLYDGLELPVGQNVQVQEITWNCGDQIQLRNFYMSWQSNAGRDCAPNPSKCYFNPDGFQVNAPLIANFSSAVVCNSYQIQFTDGTTGGDVDNPYSYVWNFGDGSPNSNVQNPIHTFPGPGDYTVTLTVTDNDGVVDDQSYIVTVYPLLVGLTLDASNVACNGETSGTITASGVSGGFGTYTYSISPEPAGYVQNNNEFSNLPSGTYTVTVTDENNCSMSQDATIVVGDNTAPIIDAPANIDVEGCDADDVTNGALTSLPYSSTPAVITELQFLAEGGTFTEDNVAQITYQDTASGTCPVVIIREFTITDDCGQSASDTQTINVNDTVAPVVPTAPADITYECQSDVPAPGDLTASDTCTGDITVTGVDSTDNSDPCNIIITRTWTFTDNCNNSSSVTQTITVSDTIAPVAPAAPADISYQCIGDVPPTGASLTATDNCSGDITVVAVDSADNSDPCNIIITRTWTFTDDCNNSSSVSQIITVADTTAPDLPSVPADTSYQCMSDVPAPETLSTGDNCAGLVEATGVDSTDNSDPCNIVITRTWTFTDDCNNSSSISQTITVSDTTAPVTPSAPADITYECIGDVPAPGDLTATDNCAGDIIVTGVDVTDNSDPCNIIITRTWTFADACNNSASVSQTITVADTTAPNITTVGADQTVLCDGTGNTQEFQAWLDTHAGANATDNCSNVTWTYEILNVIDQCGETSRTLVRFIATDDCDNANSTTALFTIIDLIPPTLDSPAADLTVECDGSGNTIELNDWLNSNGGATATDICSNVTWSNDFTGLSDDCGETGSATVTFTATDDCGNEVSSSATFTIHDTQNPVAPSAPADITYECVGDVPAAADLTATDNCSGDITVAAVDVTDDSNPCNVVITRTWTFTDDCNNTSSVSQTITVADTIAPTIDTPAGDISIECDGSGNNGAIEDWLNNNGGAVASDNCSDVTWTNNYGGTASDCSAAIEVTFTATDACGNSTSTTASYAIQDTTPPTVTSASSETVECDGSGNLTQLNDWLNNNGGATATDDCSAISWSNDFTGLSDDCGETGSATVTFTATDGCGNESSTTATFTIQDTIAPLAPSAPADITYECIGDVPAATDLTATDDCSGDITVAAVDTTDDSNPCNVVITRTWTFTDDCNNTSSISQTITVADTIAPVAPSAPADITYECVGDVPVAADLTATDNCSGDITVAAVDTTDDSNPCNVVITRTWTFTDDCNNTSSVSQTITVADTIAPVAPSAPADITYECVGDVPVAADLTATDNCSGDITVAAVDTTDDSNPCNVVITRTWTFTDDCNNTSSVSQTITVTDTIAPTIDTPAGDISIECDGSGNNGAIEDWLNNNGGAVASDNCSDVTWTNNYGGTASDCSAAIEVTFTATDACGNSTSTTASYAIQDTTPPTVTSASSETVECDGSGNLTQLNDWLNNNGGATATDDCSAISWSNDFTGLSDDCGETGSATVTFTATDGCGNESSTTATFTIQDTIAPLAPSAPADITYECIGDVPAATDLTATDDCSGDITVAAVDTTDDSNPCNVVITRTWTFTDDCNNTSSVSQTITVADTIAPVAPSAPADITYECAGDVPVAADLTATDNCSGDITVAAVDTTDDSNPCNVVITRTWTFTDDCNNTSSISQTITVADTIAPVAPSAPADITYECVGDVPAAADLTATDNCSGDITVAAVDVTDDSNPCNVVITRTWTFTDDCNNTSSVSQTITVADTIAPVAPSAPADITYECAGDVPVAADLTATDNCSGDITVAAVDTTDDSNPCNVVITRTWTFTDDCNNTSSISQTITVADTIAPVAPDAPADITYSCIVDVPDMMPLSTTDNCDGELTSQGVETMDNSDLCNVVITRTWDFVDACGNSTSVTQTISVIDTTPPSVTNDLSDITVTCDAIPDPPVLQFDECSTNVEIIGDNPQVTSTFDINNPGDYQIVWTWNVIDHCNLKAVFTQNVFVEFQDFVTTRTDDRCTDDGAIDLFDYYSGSDPSGTWEVISGDTTLDGSIFDPLEVELGDYIFSYSVEDSGCLSTTEVVITVNDDCVVLPCNDVTVSTAVTPNGDQWNEYFEVLGIEECGFEIDLKIFNRWGAMIFEASSYNNDWNGTAHSSSFGNSDKVPTGTYYYIINLKNSGLKPITGYFYVGTK